MDIVSFRKKNILIVDDEKAFLHAMKRLFDGPEYAVETAETIQDAIELIRIRNFDIAMTDIRLTDALSREGLQLLEYIKEKSPGTKVIIVTGYGDPEIMGKAYDMGASVYLEKPVSANILRSVIRNQGR